MKKEACFLLFIVLAFFGNTGKAQSFGLEEPIMEKNFFVGVKGGVSALDMMYQMHDTSFINPSQLYQGPNRIIKHMVAGLVVERSIPNFTYGLELNVSKLSAAPVIDTTKPAPLVTRDSCYLVNVRVPIRVRFLEKKLFSPYIVAAPSVGTYFSGKWPLSGTRLDGYSEWNGQEITWGTKNTKNFFFSLYAGIGVEGKIYLDTYQFRLRLEGGYNLGLTNMSQPQLPERKVRGWEASLGIVFPLLINPSYRWMM